MARRMRVYVAGAYSADNVVDVLRNIGRGIQWSTRLFLKGYAPFIPWLNFHIILSSPDSDYTVEDFYGYTLAWLDVSEAVFVLPNSQHSTGTQAEIRRAEELQIPVFHTIESLNLYRKFGGVMRWLSEDKLG